MSTLITTDTDKILEHYQSKITDYIAENGPIYLYILTPCYGGVCNVTYMVSLIKTLEIFRSLGIAVKYEFCRNDSLVSRARNNLVAKAMHDNKTTHMIFIDNDITWSPYDIVKLLLSRKSLVGGAYPIKNYNWGRLIDPANPGRNIVKEWIDGRNNAGIQLPLNDETFIQSKLLRYNINYKSSTLEIINNVAEVRHLATGFMLFERKTIETMMAAYPATKYTDDVSYLEGDENNYAYALFDCGVYEGHYYSEDWLFCHRWNEIGGNIFLDISIHLNHSGSEDYRGSYLGSLM